MFRKLIDYGYQIFFGENTSEALANELKLNNNGILKKNYGLVGGNVYFINPAPRVNDDGELIPPTFKTADILNSLDQQAHGRKAESGLRYLLGGDFIIARTEQCEEDHTALNNHQLFTRALTRPADYIHSTIKALENFIIVNGSECSLRSLSTIPLRNSIAKGLFNIDEITPEFNLALESFTGLTEDRTETLETTIWTKLKLAYYGWVLDYMPRVAKAKEQYISAAAQVINVQKDKVLSDLHNYKDIAPNNIFSLSIIQLIREQEQLDQKALTDYLANMSENDLAPYLQNAYIRTLPAVISPADMITIPIVCALTVLANDQTLQQQLREELITRDFFADNDSVRMQKNIEQDKLSGGLLHRIFIECLRRESPQKDIHDLERSTILWRYSENEMTIGDEQIEPGSLIAIMNALQRFDKNIWKTPEAFNPDRYLLENGSMNKQLEAVVISIFTDGRRKCPANRVTEYIFQAYIAHLISNYQLSVNNQVDNPLGGELRFTLNSLEQGLELKDQHRLN